MSKIDRPVIPVTQVDDKLVLDVNMEKPNSKRGSKMTSKEALEKLYKYNSIGLTGDYELFEPIKRDLEVLDIIKKHFSFAGGINPDEQCLIITFDGVQNAVIIKEKWDYYKYNNDEKGEKWAERYNQYHNRQAMTMDTFELLKIKEWLNDK